jgi:hypothetical protein
MHTSMCLQTPPNRPILVCLSKRHFAGLLRPALRLVALLVALAGTAEAQSLGYVLNSTDGSVTIFGSAPSNGSLADSTLKTVDVCATPSNAAVTPDFKHVYVTCPVDNSLWIIEVTDIGLGTATSHAVAGLQLSGPAGIAIFTVKTGANAGKTLAYVANSTTNTISVIDTETNTLYDGPIALGVAPGTTTGAPFAALVAVAPDPNTTKVFATTNNLTPQLWMIDATVTHETAVQIQAPDIPASANDSIYLSVQQSASGSDCYVLLTTSTSSKSLYLVDVEPAVPVGSPGSSTNAFSTVVPLGASQPTHIVSLMTGGGLFGESPPDPAFLTALTVDQTNLWLVNFTCTPGAPESCSLSSKTSTQVVGGGFLPNAPDGLGLTGVPFQDSAGAEAFENVYITDGEPTEVIQVPVNVSTAVAGAPVSSAVTVGQGALPPVFSQLANGSSPVVFFSDPPLSAVRVNDTVTAVGVSFASLGGKATVSLIFANIAQFKSDVNLNPEATIGGSAMFPQSGVYTVTLESTGLDKNDQPLTPGHATRTVIVGANCTLSSAGVAPAPNSIAVGQTVTVNLPCLAPDGDSIAGTLAWGDGAMVGPNSITATNNNTATLTFSHSYANPNSYNISVVSLTDDSDSTAGSVVGGTVAVTANPLAVSVSPPAVSVQVPSHTAAFAAGVLFDPTTSGVDWALSGSDCSATTCGTLSNVTLTSVTYTAPSAAPPSGLVSLTATSKASISYPNPNKSFSVPITLTALPPPSCTLSAPSTGQTGVSIKADVTCIAAAGDSLIATLSWGDGTTAATNSATVGSNGSADFSSFTHAYATASNPSYLIGLSVTDSTTGLAGSVTPPSRAITVFQSPTLGPPAAMSSVSIVPGQSITVPFNLSGGATNAGTSFNTIACAVAPAGPSCTVSPSVILDSTGNGTVQLTVITVGPETTAAVLRGREFSWLSSSLIALPGLGFVFLGLGASTPRSKKLLGLSVCLLAGLAILGAGCGSTTQRSNLFCTACTPTGSYTVTVMATSQQPVLHASGAVSVVIVNH